MGQIYGDSHVLESVSKRYPFPSIVSQYHLTDSTSFFIFGGLYRVDTISGHAFRRTAAGAFGPDLAKKLSQLVKMEKNVMRSMELVGRERMEVAVSSCSPERRGISRPAESPRNQ